MKKTIQQYSAALAGLLMASAGNVGASIPTTYPTGSGISIGYTSGHVVYGLNSVGDRIPDYSSAGYGGGGVTIPTPAVTDTLSPSGGDDTTALQNAINSIGGRSIGANGFRGVLKLNAGVFHINTALTVNFSGIVIRGAGSASAGTILRRTVNNGDAITVDNGGGLKSQVGSTYTITTSYVPVGATYFALNTTSGLSVGDTISISRNPTTAWISQLPESQTTRGYGVSWDRVITEIDGNRIRVDAPVNQAIETQWGGGTVIKYTWSSRLSNVGVEDLRADAPGDNTDTLGNTDGNFVTFSHVINCWVRRCYNDKMRGHTAKFDGSKWCTCEDLNSFHNGTAASHSGASIQIFTGSFSDGILYHHLTARSGGFEFTAGSQNGGPIVFTESEVPDGFAASGPHQQGNTGMVWDDLSMPGQGISVQYQGHGWNGFNLLAYNVDNTTYNFERPSTVHQWIIGCTGSWNPAKNGSNPEVISFGTHISPAALYRAQLIDRVGTTQANAVLGATTIGDTDPGTGGGSGDNGGTFEAETLAIAGSTGDPITTNSDANASGGQFVQYAATGVNDSINFVVPNIAPGTYTLSIGVKKYVNRGIVQVQVNKAGSTPGNIGSPVDLYSGSTVFTEISIGTWTIGSTGDKWVQFLVTGKNASSSGYQAAIDYIKLTPQ
jgi:hypothetical protein